MGTIGGARCLGREAEIGSLEVGKLADVALWDLDGLGHAGIADPVAALVFGPPAAAAAARRRRQRRWSRTVRCSPPTRPRWPVSARPPPAR